MIIRQIYANYEKLKHYINILIIKKCLYNSLLEITTPRFSFMQNLINILLLIKLNHPIILI